MSRIKNYIEDNIIGPTAKEMVKASGGVYEIADMALIAWDHFIDDPEDFDPSYLVGVSRELDW